jgi:hypothetical protein
MASRTRKITPPFSWLGPYAGFIVLAVITLMAAGFRFFRLDTLPPGLSGGVATSALESLKLIEQRQLPGFDVASTFAPVWVWLQAVPISLLGPTELAVRLWPALIGTSAVITMWLWLKSWFGQRIAWIGALLLAVSPWSVTLSRSGGEVALMPFLVTSLLWLLTIAWRTNHLGAYLGAAGIVLVSLLSGPLGWMIVASVGLFGLIHIVRERRGFQLTRPRLISLAALAVVIAIATYAAVTSLAALGQLPQIAGLRFDIGSLWNNLIRTLLMFSVPGAGDQNPYHNVAGQPLLNVFLGLMLVTGLLVSISRLHARRYRWLLGLTCLLILPAVVTDVGVPNAGRTAAAMPLVLAIATIGISYMLELWYATFPINSAARTIGQSAILVLLGLTVFQGYTQYFRAWAGSSEVHAAYNEGAIRLATNLRTDKSAGSRFVVGTHDQQAVVAYLGHKSVPYQALTSEQITALPITPGPRKFFILANQRDAAMKTLKLKFPGGILRPHYSLFNQAEVYYTYETTK